MRPIEGRGAFRTFEDQMHQRGLAESWYAFRAGRHRQIAVEWCEANGLELEPEA